jgi:hypothetical protein
MESAMKNRKIAAPPLPEARFVPEEFLATLTGEPDFDFRWGHPKEKKGEPLPAKLRGKRRLIGHPNDAMRAAHAAFKRHLAHWLSLMGDDGKYLVRLPSATGCVAGSNPIANALRHEDASHFYVTDFAHAYQSVDLERLTLLLVFLARYPYYRSDYTVEKFAKNELAHFAMRTDPMHAPMRYLVARLFAGMYGKGLAVGGPLSPMLLNLYCEVFLDSRLRYKFLLMRDVKEPERTVTYTRYVDDLVFSRGMPIPSWMRAEIRQYIAEAGFPVNHRKSRVLSRDMGTVFVTKVGLRSAEDGKAVLVFPQKKRRRLHGIIGSYLTEPFQRDDPETIRGLVAEFIHHYKHVGRPTESDKKTFALCKEFERVSEPYRKDYKKKRKQR